MIKYLCPPPLTRINQHVLACVRKKMPDEVDKVWTRNGRIFYKSKANHIHELKYKKLSRMD